MPKRIWGLMCLENWSWICCWWEFCACWISSSNLPLLASLVLPFNLYFGFLINANGCLTNNVILVGFVSLLIAAFGVPFYIFYKFFVTFYQIFWDKIMSMADDGAGGEEDVVTEIITILTPRYCLYSMCQVS